LVTPSASRAVRERSGWIAYLHVDFRLDVLRADDRFQQLHLPAASSTAARSRPTQLTVMTRAEVVCADGVGGVEAVVVRHAATGRLSAVNALAFISFDDKPPSRREGAQARGRRKRMHAAAGRSC
jgi:hypothetical protein